MDNPPEFRRGNAWFRKALNSVVRYVTSGRVDASGIPGWSHTPQGWRPPVRAKAAGALVPSFTIRASGEGVTLADGKVHISAELGGLSEDITPNIGGTLISATSAPVLTLATGANDIYMTVELVPAAEEVPGSSPTEYRVGGYSSVVDDEVTISTTKSTQEATVNTTTGAAGDNLIASWYIGAATKTVDGTDVTVEVSRPQNRYGPITVNACGSAISVFAPVFLNLDYDA